MKKLPLLLLYIGLCSCGTFKKYKTEYEFRNESSKQLYLTYFDPEEHKITVSPFHSHTITYKLEDEWDNKSILYRGNYVSFGVGLTYGVVSSAGKKTTIDFTGK